MWIRRFSLLLCLAVVIGLASCGTGMPQGTPPSASALAVTDSAEKHSEPVTTPEMQPETPSPFSSESAVAPTPSEVAVDEPEKSLPPLPKASPKPAETPTTTPVPTGEVQTATPSPVTEVVSVSVLAGGGALVNREIPFAQGMSAYDALQKTCTAAGITVSASGSGSSAYVRGIGGWNEFDQGPGSGWLYFVNGVSPSQGCGAYQLHAGDAVCFRYTTDYGRDLD